MRDRFNLVPPQVRASIENEEAVDRQVGTARWLDKELKAEDPNLSLVFIKPGIPEWELPTGAVAGRWHVERQNPGLVNTYYPITDPLGGFREPDGHLLVEMAERDLHRPGAMRERLEAPERRREAKRKATALEDEQGRDEMVSDFKAARRVPGEGGLRRRMWGRGRS